MIVAGFELDSDFNSPDPLAGIKDPLPYFRNPYYYPLNSRRLEHLATLGLPVYGRSVLEVGAGVGDLTEFFLDRGCTVTATDARSDNLDVIARRFRRNDRLTTQPLDLDAPEGSTIAPHEVVLCYGVLYHLVRPAETLRFLASKARDMLLLETVVSSDTDDRCELVPESVTRCSQSLRGQGARPSRVWIMKSLAESFEWVYTTRSQPWHGDFPRRWESLDPHRVCRAIFVGSRRELKLPTLTRELPLAHQNAEPAP